MPRRAPSCRAARSLAGALVAASLLAAPAATAAVSWPQAKQDIKTAAHETGHAIAQGAHAAGHAIRHTAHALGGAIRRAVHGN
ncbi:MAG TPA: hypothetical protein VNE67_12445 [Acetobacteraceae bacterium]|nr:hypothetical protein [Acetobacteraceae bacterium]